MFEAEKKRFHSINTRDSHEPIFSQPSYVGKHFIYKKFNKQTPSIGDVTSEAEKTWGKLDKIDFEHEMLVCT